jgi:prevent-host-death family protein
MQQTITLEEARGRLEELIAGLQPGEEVVITHQGRPVARLVAEPPLCRNPRQPGSAVGKLSVIKEDDEHLKDFAEYMLRE